jgi:hypothetical protein
VTAAVSVLVGAGLLAALAAGLGGGFDAVAIVLFAALAAVGALGIAVARRSTGGGAGPARCAGCGGLVSRAAPLCKHCGAPLPAGRRDARS